jgi:hypothetical protein
MEGFGTCLIAWVDRFRDLYRTDAEGYGQVKIFGPETMTSHLYEGGTGSYVKALLADPKALEAIGNALHNALVAGDVTVKVDKATFQMTPESIVTFSGKIAQ